MVVGVFSLSHGKLATYILPALPPLAALTALRRRRDPTPARRWLAAGGFVLLIAALPRGDAGDDGDPRRALVAGHRGRAAHLLIFPVGAVVLAAWWWRRGIPAATALIPPLAVLVALVFYTRVRHPP